MITLQQISDTIKSKGKFWIAFTGDSITSSEWVHPNWREIVEYVLKEELQKMFGDDWKIPSWGLRGFNFAFDGATTGDILEKIDDIKSVNPDLVIGLMGSNDRIRLPLEEHVENIKKIVENLDTQVVWCNSICFLKGSERNNEYKPFAEASMQIPNSEKLQLIDMFNIYKSFPLERFFTFKSEENPVEGVTEGQVDDIHPNQLGNAYIAKVILKEVFGIEFDPEKYWKETLAGEKYPNY
jgi:lysophospholipase L1-like esterase